MGRSGTILIGCALLAALCVGCRGDVERRLEKSVGDIEQHGEPSDLPILLALRKATPRTLETPQLVYARLYASARNVRLWVEWIEAKPTPDAVLIRNAQTGFAQTFEIDDTYRAENERQSKQCVMFSFVHVIEPESDAWSTLRGQIAGGNADAVMLRDGTEVSNVVSVELHE